MDVGSEHGATVAPRTDLDQQEVSPATRTDDGPPAEIDVSIIIVTYNAGDYVRACLQTLLGVGRPAARFEVIVVDNASTPPLAPLLREYLDESSIVALEENIGFGRACNLGAERARGRHVLLLNPDAEVRGGTIDALIRAADAEPRAGVLGGRTVTRTGEVDPHSCWGAPTLWSSFCFATALSTVFARSALFDPESLGKWARDSVRDVDVVTGSLLLVPMPVWREVGGFDPAYFMYAEDADLCRRIRRTGRRVWITPDAVALHSGGASSSSGDKTVMLMKGRVTYARKHFGRVQGPVIRALLLAGVALRGQGFRLLGRRDVGWVAAWARRDEWRHGYQLGAEATR
ncbi:glycosyltransferase family 2 protein [Pengzhenrongella sicca]|uniref:Glycosyltransferase family 2 protein n=1 Tax=Pengzhenrongella sicca TaxID=2819238 RepID=A0A8A4ZCN4_9MICO|nr:glycosyltransferase family 2 protein [Pengzhenrongella sicca]QTE29654.1 glycosyltransferase family 2 protein [Pengzhenrongella sicca]